MNSNNEDARRTQAAMALGEAERRIDAAHVVGSLSDGLTTVANLFFERIHHDVEEEFGTDSLLGPVSEERCADRVKKEIEAYQVAVCAEEVATRGYMSQETSQFAHWLASLRLGDDYTATRHAHTLSEYLAIQRQERRLRFEAALERCLREVSLTPLVLFRLYPLSVRIATAVAFQDSSTAADWRREQINRQPAITYCHDCRGQVLPNGEFCHGCGNPVWHFDWLRTA